MKTPKVSVVVPIYNVERYLRQCLDSIVSQTLRDIEIILVDDGSPDGSPAIADEYAARDDRVVVIHRKNGGWGAALNTGVARATGEYIGIVESDDWIEPDMYELLYNAAKEHGADVSKSPFYTYDSTAKKQDTLWVQNVWGHKIDLAKDAPKSIFAIEDFPELMLFHASIWSYLYRADFVRHIPFLEDAGASYQDFPFSLEVLCRARNIIVVPKPLLHWRNEENQSNSTSKVEYFSRKMPARNLEGKAILYKYGKYDALKEEFYAACALINYGIYNRVRNKYEYMLSLREIFKDIDTDSDFRWKYFSKESKEWVRNIIHKKYLRILLPARENLRRFLLSVCIRPKRGILLQILGLQLAIGKYADEYRPALWALRLGKKR